MSDRILVLLLVVMTLCIAPAVAEETISFDQILSSLFGKHTPTPTQTPILENPTNVSVIPQKSVEPVKIRISGLVANQTFWIFGYVSTPDTIQIMRQNLSVETIESVTCSDDFGLFMAGPYLAGTGTYQAKIGSIRSNRVTAPPAIHINQTAPEVVPQKSEEFYDLNMTVDPTELDRNGWVFVMGRVLDAAGKPVRGTVDCYIAEGNSTAFSLYDRVKTDSTGSFRFDMQRWEPYVLQVKTVYMDGNGASQAETEPVTVIWR